MAFALSPVLAAVDDESLLKIVGGTLRAKLVQLVSNMISQEHECCCTEYIYIYISCNQES